MSIRVKFYVPETVSFGRVSGGHAESIVVPTDDIGVAFEAACNAGGDPNRKMLYTTID